MEFIKGSRSNLVKEILEYADQVRKDKAVQKAKSERMAVLLDTHLNDQLYAFDLGKKLVENASSFLCHPIR